MDLENLTIRQMRRVAKMLAIKKVDENTTHWVLNELIDSAKTENSCVDDSVLMRWKTTFLYDYFEKGIAKCKTCGKEDTVLAMRRDVCENCI